MRIFKNGSNTFRGHNKRKQSKNRFKNIQAFKEFLTPRNPKNIKQFLGLIGYYRWFIPNFSKIIQSLIKLLKENVRFDSAKRPNSSVFAIMRFIIFWTYFIILRFYQTVFTTDASSYAIRYILSQCKIGQNLPIIYTSRLLNSAEQNYSTIEKELICNSLLHQSFLTISLRP